MKITVSVASANPPVHLTTSDPTTPPTTLPCRSHLTNPSASTLTSHALRVPFANQLTVFLPDMAWACGGVSGFVYVCVCMCKRGECTGSLLRLCLMLVKTTLPAIIKINHNILRPLSSATEIDRHRLCESWHSGTNMQVQEVNYKCN